MLGLFGSGKDRDIVSEIYAEEMSEEDRKRTARIRESWRAYENQLPDPLNVNDLDPKGEDNTRIGMARKLVNLSAFYLFGKGLEWDIDGEADGDTPAMEYLSHAFDAQGDGTVPYLIELATGGGIEGDVFVRLYPPRAGELYPRIVPQSAENVIVRTEPHDHTDAYEFVIMWNSFDSRIKKPVVYRHTFTRQDSGAWTILEEHSTGTKAWVTDLEEDWPYKFAPIQHCKNMTWPQNYFGASDLEDDVIEVIKAVNFNVSNRNRILRAHGHPTDVGFGFTLDGVEKAVGKMLVVPNPEGRIDRMGEIDKLTAHDEQFRVLKEAFHDLTSVPEVAAGRVQDIGQLSGLALQILYAPLAAMIETKRRLYGGLLASVGAAMLEMGGYGEARKIELKWPEIVPVNLKEQAETGVLLDSVGVSKKTILSKMGFDPEEEALAKADEAESAATAFDRGMGGGVGDVSPPDPEDDSQEPGA